MVHLSPGITAMEPYPFEELDRRKAEAHAEGRDLIDFGVGDPREVTAPFIREALRDAVEPTSFYPRAAGLPELRAAIAGWAARRYGVDLDPDEQILPLLGSKELVFSLAQAVLDPAGGKDLVVVRQTMSDSVQPVTVTSPSGATHELTLNAGEPGEWRASVPASELGLWQATDGTLKALINVGPTNPKEFSEVTSTTDQLKPLAQATGGDAVRVVDGSSVELPRIVPVRASSIFRGDGWLGVKMRDASVVKGVGVLPMFAGLVGLLLLLGAFAATWLREGR